MSAAMPLRVPGGESTGTLATVGSTLSLGKEDTLPDSITLKEWFRKWDSTPGELRCLPLVPCRCDAPLDALTPQGCKSVHAAAYCLPFWLDMTSSWLPSPLN